MNLETKYIQFVVEMWGRYRDDMVQQNALWRKVKSKDVEHIGVEVSRHGLLSW